MKLKEYLEKRDWHFSRLDRHVGLVQNFGKLIEDLNLTEIDRDEFVTEIAQHDKSKRCAPELSSYIDISWFYKLKNIDGIDMELTPELEKAMDAATSHHVKNNKHHPEFWTDELSTDGTMRNREAVVKPAIDVTIMPLTHIACMCADWLAMGEELGNKAKDWADQNVGKKWKFNEEQKNLIYKIIGLLE